MLVGHFRHDLMEIILILVVDESVVKDALSLVYKEPQNLQALPDIARITLQDTLDTLGQIPQVEDVVGLRGRRQEVRTHAEIHLHGRVDDRLGTLAYGVRKVLEEAMKNSLKQCNNNSMKQCNNNSMKQCNNNSLKQWNNNSLKQCNNNSLKQSNNNNLKQWNNNSLKQWDNNSLKQ